jgi:hypothetical protein
MTDEDVDSPIARQIDIFEEESNLDHHELKERFAEFNIDIG